MPSWTAVKLLSSFSLTPTLLAVFLFLFVPLLVILPAPTSPFRSHGYSSRTRGNWKYGGCAARLRMPHNPPRPVQSSQLIHHEVYVLCFMFYFGSRCFFMHNWRIITVYESVLNAVEFRDKLRHASLLRLPVRILQEAASRNCQTFGPKAIPWNILTWHWSDWLIIGYFRYLALQSLLFQAPILCLLLEDLELGTIRSKNIIREEKGWVKKRHNWRFCFRTLNWYWY